MGMEQQPCFMGEFGRFLKLKFALSLTLGKRTVMWDYSHNEFNKRNPITSVGCTGRDSLCCEQSFIPLLVPMSHDWKGDKWSIFCLLSIFNKCVAKAGILRLWWLSPEPRLLKNHTQFSKKLVAEGCNGSKTLLDPAFLIGSPWALMLQTQNLNR